MGRGRGGQKRCIMGDVQMVNCGKKLPADQKKLNKLLFYLLHDDNIVFVTASVCPVTTTGL